MKKLILIAFALILAVTPVFASGLKLCSWNGWATLGKDLTNDLSGQLGLGYTSAAGTGTTFYLLKVDYKLAKVGKIQPAWGIYYNSSSAAGATATIGLTWGVSVPVWKNLALGYDIIVANSTGNTTRILPNTTFTASYGL